LKGSELGPVKDHCGNDLSRGTIFHTWEMEKDRAGPLHVEGGGGRQGTWVEEDRAYGGMKPKFEG